MRRLYFALFLTTSAILAACGLYNMAGFREIPEIRVSQYTLYSKWAAIYGKVPLTRSEYLYRLNIFGQNQKLAKKLNREYPDTIYGTNIFSDLSFEEFLNRNVRHNLKGGLQRIVVDNRGEVGVVKKQPLFSNISEAFAGSTMVEGAFHGRVSDVSP